MMTMLNTIMVMTILSSQVTPPEVDDLIVHEWGTFTSVVDPDGKVLQWTPWTSGDLPSFVYMNDRYLKRNLWGRVRMETPVIYFHTEREMTLDVEVGFPSGVLTEWYPRAKSSKAKLSWPGLSVVPDSNSILRTELRGAHYFASRGVAAAPVRVPVGKSFEEEKFLFYRGIGDFPIPIDVHPKNDHIVVRLATPETVDRLMLFERRGDEFAYAIHCGLSHHEPVAIFDRTKLNWSKSLHLDDLKKILRQQGLYEDESQAMVDTWRHDWFEEGLRVFYTVPRRMTDEILPLKIDPAPVAMTRVIIGRVEVMTKSIENALINLASNVSSTPENELSEKMRQFSRFSIALLQQRHAASGDELEKLNLWTLINHMRKSG